MAAPICTSRPWRVKGARQAVQQALGDGCRGGVIVAARGDDEFVSAQATDGVARAHAVGQALADLQQQGIARCVAHGVVDGLEAIQVDEEHGAMGVIVGLAQ